MGRARAPAYPVYAPGRDLCGAEADAGKALGTAIAGGNATLPVILLCEQAGPDIHAQLNQMIQRWDDAELNILRGWLSEFNALEQSQSKLESCLDDARDALGALHESAHRDALLESVSYTHLTLPTNREV